MSYLASTGPVDTRGWNMRSPFAAKRAPWSLLVLLLLWVGVANAQPQWEREKGDCDKILMSTKRSRRNLSRVSECTELFLTYRDPTILSPKQRRKYRRGFSVLYYKGDEDGRENALEALKMIDAKPLDRDLVFPEEAEASSAVAKHRCVSYPEVSAARERKARKYNKKGLKAYRRRKYRKAVSYFEKAMKADPNYLEAIYNAACNYALLRDSRAAVELLRDLKSRCGREPRVFLRKAHRDRDFRYIRKDPEWREVTGYVEILLLNGAGPEGEPHVARIKRDMATMGRRPAFVGTDKYPRSKPLIYYKPAFKELAEKLKDVVASPSTKLKEINFNTAIRKYNFDIIVVWGMPHRTALKEIPKVKTGGGGGGEGGGGGKSPFDAIKDATGTVKDAKGAVDDAAGTAKDASTLPTF